MRSLVSMIHSKNNNGFTLIEVMVSVVILGLLLTPLFIWHSGNLGALVTSSNLVRRVLAARNFMVDTYSSLAPDTRATTMEKKITHPTTVLVYELKDKLRNPELAALKGLCQEQVLIRWQENGRTAKETSVALCYRKEERKE